MEDAWAEWFTESEFDQLESMVRKVEADPFFFYLDFLTNRTQRVRVNGSDKFCSSTGSPQGCVLSLGGDFISCILISVRGGGTIGP